MSDTDVQVIINEIKHITNELQNLRQEIALIKTDSKERCKDCVTTVLLKERLRIHWLNIAALWTLVGAVGLALLTSVLSGR